MFPSADLRRSCRWADGAGHMEVGEVGEEKERSCTLDEELFEV